MFKHSLLKVLVLDFEKTLFFVLYDFMLMCLCCAVHIIIIIYTKIKKDLVFNNQPIKALNTV